MQLIGSKKNLQLNDDCIKYLKKDLFQIKLFSDFRMDIQIILNLKFMNILKRKNFSEDEIVRVKFSKKR